MKTKIIYALQTGAIRTARSWKGILIVWLFYLLFVALLVIPLRSSLKSAFGSSMITERFAGGFDVEAFSDLETAGRSILSSLSGGLLIAIISGLIMNAFLSGGLFAGVKADAGRFSTSVFFRESGKYFWKFLLISLILSVSLVFLGTLIFILPVSLIVQSEPASEKIPFIVGIISGVLFLMFTGVNILVADYARAWNAVREEPVCFRAIGFGISRTFTRFPSSIILVLIIMAIQVFLIFFVLRVIGPWRPASGGGVFLLFIISQIIFFLRIFIKTWRYGSVTNLMELNDKRIEVITNLTSEPVNEKTDSY